MACNPKPCRRAEKRWLADHKRSGRYRDIKLHMKLKDTGARENRKRPTIEIDIAVVRGYTKAESFPCDYEIEINWSEAQS